MKTIRKGVFETNSSSSHSITVEVGPTWGTLPLNHKGNIHLDGGEFGWEWEKFNDTLTKANYCAVYASYTGKKSILKKVIKDYTGAKKVKFKFSTNWDHGRYNHSYIDHQSIDVCDELFESEEELKNFIFNDSSWLFTGNDNGVAPSQFYDNPYLPYTHELVINLGPFELTHRFQKAPTEESVVKALVSITNDFYYEKEEDAWYKGYSWGAKIPTYSFHKYWYNSEPPINFEENLAYFYSKTERIEVPYKINEL